MFKPGDKIRLKKESLGIGKPGDTGVVIDHSDYETFVKVIYDRKDRKDGYWANPSDLELLENQESPMPDTRDYLQAVSK